MDRTSSRRGRRCSHVMPDDPLAIPFRVERKFGQTRAHQDAPTAPPSPRGAPHRCHLCDNVAGHDQWWPRITGSAGKQGVSPLPSHPMLALSNANFKAFWKGLRTMWGTLFITVALWRKIAGSISSRMTNAFLSTLFLGVRHNFGFFWLCPCGPSSDTSLSVKSSCPNGVPKT